MPTVLYLYLVYINRLAEPKVVEPESSILLLVRCGYGAKPKPFFLLFIRCTLSRTERNNSSTDNRTVPKRTIIKKYSPHPSAP